MSSKAAGKLNVGVVILYVRSDDQDERATSDKRQGDARRPRDRDTVDTGARAKSKDTVTAVRVRVYSTSTGGARVEIIRAEMIRARCENGRC
jgi:hypothetical protein